MAESEGDFEHTFVAIQLNHVTRAVQHGGTVPAPACVLFDGNAQSGVDFAVEIV
jgi:hypothetical protein